MDTLRWILLALGLVLIAAVWIDGVRRRPAHEESLLQSARRRWRGRTRRKRPEARTDPADVDLQSREGPDFGFDPGDLDALVDDEPAREREQPARTTPETSAADATAAPAEVPTAAPEEEPAAADPVARAGQTGGGEPASARKRPRESFAADASDDERRTVVLYVVAPPGERFSGDELAAAFAHLGLEFGDMDLFHRFDENDRALFSIANATREGTFDPDTMAEMETRGVALFARLPAPGGVIAVFDELARTAHALANLLGGRALDDRQSTLTRQTEQAMRDELREYEHRRARAPR